MAPSESDVSANANRPAEELAEERNTRGVPGIVGSPGVSLNSLGSLLGLA